MDKPPDRIDRHRRWTRWGCASRSRSRRRACRSSLIEALGDDNFLEQVPRAGTNHPATLELFERIGLYKLLEPRGIIAPKFHYWDRHEGKLIAEFDHIHLKDDTAFPYVLQCERIKIVEEALKLAKAHPNIDLRLSTTFTAFTQDADGVTATVTNLSGETETIRGRYIVSGEGARSIIRKELGHRVRRLHLFRSHAQHRGGLRFPQARLHRAQLHLRS